MRFPRLASRSPIGITAPQQPLRLLQGNGLKRLILPLALVISITQTPIWAEVAIPKIVTYTLPTGQTLYIKEDHSNPIVTIDTWVKTGSVNETPSNNGVSHFLEHLLFKGTPTHQAGEIDRMLESRGSEFNAATSDDFTHYYITTATPYFQEALKLHADMMENAAVPTEELPQERKVVQEEINRANDNPSRQLYIAMSKLMYGNHGYGLDTLGPKENIASIPRESILAYYHYWYQPKNFNTVIVGDVNPEQVKQWVQQAFPAPQYQIPKQYEPPMVSDVPRLTQSQGQVLQNPAISQSYYAIGFLGPAQQNPKDVYALDIAMLALGGGKSSRLYQALKEAKPLATDISASNYTQKHSGLLIINGESSLANREAVKQELIRQLRQLKEQGITQAELDKAKNQYIKDFVFENESTDGTASSIGYNVTIGSLDDYLNHVQQVEQVTLAQVQAALQHYLDFNRAVVVELLPQNAQLNVQAENANNLALLKTADSPQGTSGNISQANPVQPSAASSSQAPTIEKSQLANGMTLLTKKRADSSTVAIKVFVKGGQSADKIPGTAALTSSLLMQGTTTKTAEQISEALESRGMSLTVSADDDFVEITGSAITEDFDALMAILEDVIKNPSFSPAQIAKKKQQIKQTIDATRDTPSAIAFENLSLSLYPQHPYGNVGKRVEANLSKISRPDILGYYQTQFKPQNMVVSVVGNFDEARLKNKMNALYTTLLAAKTETSRASTVQPLTVSKSIEEKKPQLSATWIAQGWLVPPISDQKDYMALKVLNSLLGSGMSSRLFIDLREKQGLAYVVGSMYPTRKQESRFVIYIGTDPVNLTKVQDGFRQEIERLQNEPISEAELANAKSKLIGSFALAHDTNLNQAYYLGLYETLGAGYQFDQHYPELVQSVTSQQIQQVAKNIFAKPSVTSIVMPAAAQAKSAAR